MLSPDTRPPIWVFNNPRTCSQLLHRMLKLHPQLESGPTYQWALHATSGGPERIQTRVDNRQKAVEADKKLQEDFIALFPPGTLDIAKESYAVASRRLATNIEMAQAKGKIPLVVEHITCLLQPPILSELICTGSVARPTDNPTTIPDRLFQDVQNPLVQIRHPALVLRSFYKSQLVNFANDVDEDAFRMWTEQRITRWLFDFLVNHGRNPILIDGEDVVFRSELLCRKLCKIWNISPNGLTFNWAARPPTRSYVHPFQHFARALEESTGVNRPEQKSISIDIEYPKWVEEFGQDVASELKKRVDADMPDYLYLQQYRLKLDD